MKRRDLSNMASANEHARRVERRATSGLQFDFREPQRIGPGITEGHFFPERDSLCVRVIEVWGKPEHWSIGLVIPFSGGWVARKGYSVIGPHYIVDRPWPLDECHQLVGATVFPDRETAARALEAVRFVG